MVFRILVNIFYKFLSRINILFFLFSSSFCSSFFFNLLKELQGKNTSLLINSLQLTWYAFKDRRGMFLKKL